VSPTRPRPRPQRRYPRLTLRVEVTLEADGGERKAVATTLGAGGLYVAGELPLAKGAPLVARFRLPGERGEVRLAARVAWRSRPGCEPGVGLEFSDPDARAHLAAELEAWALQRED